MCKENKPIHKRDSDHKLCKICYKKEKRKSNEMLI